MNEAYRGLCGFMDMLYGRFPEDEADAEDDGLDDDGFRDMALDTDDESCDDEEEDGCE